jgi:hypothetical protein
MYPVGTLKVTWINENDYKTLRSQMFKKDELEEAIAYGKFMAKNDFMIFELVDQPQNDSYTWKLLPYGDAKRFVRTMENFNSTFFKLAVVTTVALAFYGLFRVMK